MALKVIKFPFMAYFPLKERNVSRGKKGNYIFPSNLHLPYCDTPGIPIVSVSCYALLNEGGADYLQKNIPMAFLSSSGWHLDPHHFSSGNNGIGGRSNSGDWRPLNAMSAGLRRSVPAQLATGILQHSGSVSTASPSGSMSPSGDQFAFPLPNSSGANGAGGNAGNRRQSSRSFKEGR